MTAEVIVMNRKGVAMAADSAGTLYVDHGYKIYNSDQKLFQLLNKSQIGMLIYGSTSLNGAPMELLIKDFREKKKKLSGIKPRIAKNPSLNIWKAPL